MTGDDHDGDDGRPDDVPIAETLDEVLASDGSGLCAGLLDVLALLSDVGAARWVLHKAGDQGLVAAPGGYGFGEVFAFEFIDAALQGLAEAGLVAIGEAEFDDAGDPGELDDSDRDGLEAEHEDADQEEDDLDEWDFDTVTVVPDAARVIMARHVAAGTIAAVGDRACELLVQAALSSAGLDSVVLTDGMTACWDHLRPYLGPADDELVKDLLAMRSWGLYSLVLDPHATEAEMTEFGEKLVADCEQALGPGHPDTWEARRNRAYAYERCQRWDEGIDAFTRLRADMERVLPADHPEILRVRIDLAMAYGNADMYHVAVSQFTQLLADHERLFGPRHTSTLVMRGALGEAYLEVGRIAEGIELMEAAAAGLAAVAGPDFPEAARLREVIDAARGH